MKEDLRPCSVKIGEETETAQFVNSEPVTRIAKEGETHRGYFHKWIDESYSCGDYSTVKTYGLIEFKDGTVHKVDPECIAFTDNHVMVDIDSKNIMITEGDICGFGKNEKVFIYVSLGSGKNNEDRYVEGFYLTGGNKGHIGRFNLKELRKTDKRFEIDNILKNVCSG